MDGELARLGLAIESDQVETADHRLDAFTESAGRAEKATDALAAGSSRSNSAIGAMLANIDKSVRELVELTRSHQALSQAVDRGATANIRYSATFTPIAKGADAAAASTAKLGAATEAAAVKTTQAGASFDTFYRAAQHDFSTQYVSQLGKMNVAHQTAAKGAKLQASEVLNLSRQIADVAVTGAMGMNPIMIAIQQGPQFADVFQTAAARGVKAGSVFKEIGGIVGGVLGKAGPFAVGAVVVGALAAAFLAGEKDAVAFNNALKATGGSAGITGGQFETMVSQVRDATGGGFTKAREALMAVASSGKFSGDQLRQVGEISVRLSELTGASASATATDFSKMGDDVVGFATKFNAQYHVLSAAQLEHIRLMQMQGNIAGATAEFINAAVHRLAERGVADLGLLERLWRGVSGAIAEAWEHMKKFGQQGDAGLKNQIDSLNAQIAAGSTGRNPLLPEAIEGLTRQRDTLQKVLTAHEAVAKAQGDATKVTDAGTAAAERMAGQWSSGADSLTTYHNDLAAFSADLDRMRKAGLALPSDAEQASKRAKIYERDMPKAAQAAKSAESAAASAAKAAEHRAQTLALENAATVATTAANFELAHAYTVSGAAAFDARAKSEAVAKAVKVGLDTTQYVQRQRDLDASKEAAGAAKTASELNAKTAAQRFANAAVIDGSKTVAQANQDAQDGLVISRLVEISDHASLEQKTKLAEVIAFLTDAQKAHNLSVQEGAVAAMIDSHRDELAALALEGKLIGANNAERIKALAILKAQQQLDAAGFDFATASPDQFKKAKTAFDGAMDVADQAIRNGKAQASYNKSLSETVDLLTRLDERGRDAAAGLASSFGAMGKAVGDFTNVLTAYGLKQAQIAKERDDVIASANGNAGLAAKAEAVASEKSTAAQLKNYGDLAGAAKGFFGEKTVLFKAAQAAEQAFRLYEVAMSVRAMIQHTAETASVAANETAKTAIEVPAAATRASAKAAEGAASMFATLGPLGFAAVAAMIAVMASFGVSKGSSGSAPGATDAADRQKAQGAGSVLGDATAKSDSIAKSLDIVAKNSFSDLNFSNQMLRSLRSIDSQIGAVATAIAKSLGAGGALSTDGLGLGKSTAGPSLGQTAAGYGLGGPVGAVLTRLLPGLFGSTTTRSLQDQGLNLGSQSVGSILGGGLQGSTYQQVLSETKKKFLGLTYSDKATSSTTSTALDADFSRQVTLLIGSLKAGVLSAADILGVKGASALIDAINLDLGKISLKDMDAQQVSDALNAVFGKAADTLASTAIPALLDLQKAGEGAFQTLTRVAHDYQTVDLGLQAIGKTFGATGLASLAARENLIELIGSLDDFVDQTNFFSENFLSDVERMAPVQKAVADEMARLNLQSVVTKDQFKDIVLGLDLTTQAGRDTYAALLAVAPAFLKVSDFAVAGSKATQDALSMVSKARDQENAQLQSTVDSLTSAGNALKTYRDSLYSGPAAMLSPEDQYAAARAALTATIARRDAGDQSAAADLPGVAGAFLDASKSFNASSANYFKDLDLVKTQVGASQSLVAGQISAAQAQLDANNKMVDGIFGTKEAVLSLRDALLAYQGTLAKPGGAAAAFDSATYANDNADLVEAYKAYAADSNPYGFSAGLDMAGFLKEHYDRTGQYEIANGGRKFAKGAGFDGSVGAATEILNRPTQLNVGQGGEAGPEAIVPLTRTRDGSLGVRANAGDNEALRSEISDLKGAVSALSNQLNNIAKASMGQQEAFHKEAQKTRIAGNDIADGTRKAVRGARAA